ncbi:MAG: LPS-assembly protein LptD [Ignavibacteria bacterium]|nr:LPS-assembly protein LptD [Ignavibacteria bacterium]
MNFKYPFYILLFFILTGNCFAQTDTAEITLDTTKIIIDTSRQVVSDIDDIISYVAEDSVIFDITEQKVYLYNKAEVIYKDLKLNAGIIILDRNTNFLESLGLPDTAKKGKFLQTPVMYQGTDKYEGLRLTYNFKTKQGSVSMGFSEAEVGYYFGERIKRVTPEVYFMQNGRYTTSTDREDPEYYFFSPKMKIIPTDKVIAQSVFLYIEGVPIFWVPFAIFPDRKGRSSGLIMPSYGNDGKYGVYISKLGYFWATNDYMDIALTGSFFTKGRYDINSRVRYNLKYNFSGDIEAGFSKISLGESTDKDKFSSTEWQFKLQHNQTINPTTSLSGNLTFVSGKSYYDNTTYQFNDLLRQNAISNLTLSKYWEETPFSLTLNYSRDQNLVNGDLSESFPSFLFNVSETYPFRSGTYSEQGAELYEYISFSYNASGRYDRYKRTQTNSSGLDTVMKDSRPGIRHSLNLNFSPKFTNFTIRPYFNYNELWYIKSVEKIFNAADSSVLTNDISGFKAVRYFQMGVALNTKLIGIFSPKVFGVTGIRHTITPTVSYNFTPDFSTDAFGYYGSYVDAQGRIIKYSKFEKEIFGGSPFGESQSIGFSIGNLFEMKTRETDTTENKFQLININAGVNYNFAADSIKWSEIRTDFRTQIGGILNIGGGATFNLYKFDPAVNSRVNQLLVSSDGKLADMTNFNINLSSSFNLDFANKKITTGSADTFKAPEQSYGGEINYHIPLSGSINYNYSQSRPNPSSFYRSSNVSGSVNFSISDRWRFTFSTSYDLVNKQISAPYFSLYRDLKSWELLFDWYPTGLYRGFKLIIRIKAPQLQDIKLEKQTNTRGVY